MLSEVSTASSLIKIDITIDGEKIVLREQSFGGNIYEYILDLKENLIKDAIIKLGWTPPKVLKKK